MNQVKEKAKLFRENIKHPAIKEIRGIGLFMAVELENFDQVKKVIDQMVINGLVTDWFLFHDSAFRIAPPLTITKEEILKACRIINKSLNETI